MKGLGFRVLVEASGPDLEKFSPTRKQVKEAL